MLLKAWTLPEDVESCAELGNDAGVEGGRG